MSFTQIIVWGLILGFIIIGAIIKICEEGNEETSSEVENITKGDDELRRMLFDSNVSLEEFSERSRVEFEAHDYLGKAAVARDEAKDAVAKGRFDDAWKMYHEEKEHFLAHAVRHNFSALQTLALDASVSKSLANVLRLEGRHREAFQHIVYWVATSNTETKEQGQKLNAYFNRCKYQNLSLNDASALIQQVGAMPEFTCIRDAVSAWE
jgi:hypothetical protein